MALPPFVDTNGQWEETRDRLYQCFCRIFKAVPRRQINGKPIVFDERRIDSDLEEGFWHVVSRGKGDDRLFDPDRARRIDWIESMLDGTAPKASSWRYTEGDGTDKLYFWLEDESFVLIFADRRSTVALVTAFYIDKPWLRKDLEKRRKNGGPI